MKVRLIGYTQPPEDIIGLDDLQDIVAYCARVSNPSNQINSETSGKLLDYLIKHKHWSPFEMCSATLEVETTRDIARQFLRHRSFSFQEFSQRYADIRDLDDNFVTRGARLQDPKNRQNSVETDDEHLQRAWHAHQQIVIKAAKNAYDWAVEAGIAKEQARAVLPEGNTETVLYMAGSLRSWIHYCDLRMANGTQKEHAEIASECWNIIGAHFPSVISALET